jgi:hypothetical protein
MRTLIKVFLPLCLLLTFAGAALAKTPDGQPPSQETVCDAETGAAYGLCNAYCEAMDCDSDAPAASATACGKVRSKFQNITGHDLPCEKVVCPCTSIPGFNALLANANVCVFVGQGVGSQQELFDAAFNHSFVDSVRCAFTPNGGAEISIPITPEEVAACYQVVVDAEASLGLTCFPG